MSFIHPKVFTKLNDYLTSEQETLVRALGDDCLRIRIQVQESFMKLLTNEYT